MSTSDAKGFSWVALLNGLGTSKTCSEIGSELNLLWMQSQDQEREAEVILLEYERQACLLTVRATISSPRESDDADDQVRFSGMVGFSDGSQWPDPNGFSGEMLAYLQRRGEETPNPVLKARYLDLTSEKHLVVDKYRMSLSAIDAYLDSAQGFSSSSHVSHQLEMIAAMDQAAFLALKFGSAEKLPRVVETLLVLINRQIDPEQPLALGNRPRGRWALELSDILLYIRASRKYGRYVADVQLERVKSVAAQLAEQNYEDGFARRRLLNVVSRAAHFLGLTAEEHVLELQRGESLVQQGQASEQQVGNGPRYLIAATFYENAVMHYAGIRERLALTAEHRQELARRENELKLKIREMYRLGRGEFSKFVVVDEFLPQDQADTEELLNALTSPDTLTECLQRIVSERTLLPNIRSAEEAASEMQGQAPLLSMLPKRSVRDDLTVAVAESEPQRLSQQVRDNLLFWIQFNSTTLLTSLFARLQEHKGLSAKTLGEFLAASGQFEEKSLPLIETGLERFFASDYISALHILVPQYEDVLRTLFEQSGQAVVRPRQKHSGWEYETLGAFLDREEVKDIFLPELLSYIRLVMTEQTGWNLRNRIAHGLVHPQDCNIVTSVTMVHLYLLLTLFRSDEKG